MGTLHLLPRTGNTPIAAADSLEPVERKNA
jgi:hypothetical protein